jgi:pyruvate kinase
VAETEVVRGGTLRSGAGLNAPSERLRLPAVTGRDREALKTVLGMEVDYLAQSFVRRAEDIRDLRRLLGDSDIPIMAKIETRSAIENLDGILAEADALMLARGDLGVEIPFEEVPIVQKRVIDASVSAGVPVVVATQMLESMVSAPRPTRAEASDVANAVLDGADAVMLSAETAIGAYPVLAARAAVDICRAAEADPALTHRATPASVEDGGRAAAIAAAAVQLVRERPGAPVAGIACFTRTGTTARLLARLRPGCPVTALSPDPAVVRRMALLRAIAPVLSETPANTDEMVGLLEAALRAAGVPDGSEVVLVASIPFGTAATNFLKLHRMGDVVSSGSGRE